MPGRIDEPEVRRMRRRLLAWYDRNRRDLPWRVNPPDPYATLVSEFMLQQTQVATVIPYFRRFMRRFPTVSHLARARIDAVLPYWAGLGYYRRCHHLHRAARAIVKAHAGVVPAQIEALRALPGVGDYTAGAVASIAYGVRAPAIDGNVRRVLARLSGADAPLNATRPLSSHATPASIGGLAERLVPTRRPGDFNQALMELGATVCTPRTPRCGDCPLRTLCAYVREAGRAAANGDSTPAPPSAKPRRKRGADLGPRGGPVTEVTTKRTRSMRLGTRNTRGSPAPRGRRPHGPAAPRTSRIAVRRLTLVTLAAHCRGRLLYIRRPVDGLWAGLWSWPMAEVAAGRTPDHVAGELARTVETRDGHVPRYIGEIEHALTHRRVLFLLYETQADGALRSSNGQRWMPGDREPRLPISTAQRKLLAARRRFHED